MADSIFNQWTNVVADGRNDLVFEQRRKDYGAYELRRRHNRTLALALLITAIACFIIVSIPTILKWIEDHQTEETAAVDNTPVQLEAPPPVDPNEPPPPPPDRKSTRLN